VGLRSNLTRGLVVVKQQGAQVALPHQPLKRGAVADAVVRQRQVCQRGVGMQRVTQGGQDQRLHSQGIVVQSASTREQSTQTCLAHAWRQRSSHSQALLEVCTHYTCRGLTLGASARCRQPKGPGTGAHLRHAESTHAGRGAPVPGSVSGANDKDLIARGRGDCSTSKEIGIPCALVKLME
jgi:hypothetical protein